MDMDMDIYIRVHVRVHVHAHEHGMHMVLYMYMPCACTTLVHAYVRNPIHLHAGGLLGEKDVVSGMRRNSELFIWVDVHMAIASGIEFVQAKNGVILTQGIDNSGWLPPDFFSVVIELADGLVLEPGQVRLLERLFSGCSRVRATMLHGGFSGSLVLKTESFDSTGEIEEPTITKMDSGAATIEETKRTKKFEVLVGADAIRVIRGPLFTTWAGEELDPSTQATDNDFGAIVLEMAGACWVLPQFCNKLGSTELVSTFKKKLVDQLSANSAMQTHDVDYSDLQNVFRELWGAGGPLTALALKTCKRDSVCATHYAGSSPGLASHRDGTGKAASSEGFFHSVLRTLAERAVVVFISPKSWKDAGTAAGKHYMAPPALISLLGKLEQLQMLSFQTVPKHDKFLDSFVHDCDAAVWADGVPQLVALLEKMLMLLRNEGAPPWLADWQPLCWFRA